MPLMANF